MIEARSEHQSTVCLNCNATIIVEKQFCAACGQKTHLHRLSIGHIVHEGVHFFLHADKSIFTLIKALARKTGIVAKEYIGGKRKKYFSPLNFYLLMAALMVLSMSTFKTFDKEAANSKTQIEAIAANIPDPAKKARVYAVIQRQTNAMYVIKKYSNIIGMCAIPLLSLIFYLFYRRGRYNYAEHLVANLYSIGFTALIFSLIIIPLMSLGSQMMYYIALGIYFVTEITYRSIFYYRFMDRKGTAPALKAFGVSLFVQLFWIVFTFSLMYWYMKSGMSGLFT